jgi:hypothetical protein
MTQNLGGQPYGTALNSKLRFNLSNESGIIFQQGLNVSNAQLVAQHVPIRLYLDYMAGLLADIQNPPGVPPIAVQSGGVAPGSYPVPDWGGSATIDIVNVDLGTYNFFTRYARPRDGPTLASYTPAIFGGAAGIDEWEYPEPIIIINLDGDALPQPEQVPATDPTYPAATMPAYPMPWALMVGGPNSQCHVIAAPINKDDVRNAIIAKDSGQTWVDREKVFDQPQGTLRALQGNKIDFMDAASDVVTNIMLCLFPPSGDPLAGERLLLGVVPVHPVPATINPGDYSAVPYNGNTDPNSTDFKNYQLRVATEWIARQDTWSAYGASLTNLCISSGHFYIIRDVLSRAPVDPDTKVMLMSSGKAAPWPFPTYLSTILLLLTRGLTFFGLTGTPGFIATASGQDYEGLPNVTSLISGRGNFPAIVNQAWAAGVMAWRALDRKQTLNLSIDVENQPPDDPSKFGALSLKYAGGYPAFKDKNQWNDLTGAKNSGLCTGQQLYQLARDGIFLDAAAKSLLVGNPNPTAVAEFTAFPNAAILLKAYQTQGNF